MEKKRPVLSISMLVSNNRRDTIEKCLESLVPLMEAVPSELIIVDTGCTDGSVDIARKYADKVVQFTWCKDFSAARNAGLKECTGEWFLYLDDDEWFEDVSELIDFFRGVEKDYCDALWYIQRNYDNFEGTVYTDAYVGRCVKLTPETEFRGKIHEWLYPLPNVLIRKNSYVHHYGYVFKTEEDRQKHMMRNLTLLEAAIEENPKDTRMCCQLVQEYWVAKRHEAAVAFCRKALELTEEPGTDSYVQYLKYTIPRLYKDAGDAAKALEEFTRLEREDVLLHQTRLGIYYEKALLYNAQGDGVEARKWFAEYLREFYRTPGEGAPKEFAIMDFAQYQSEFFRLNAVYGGVRNMVRCNCFDEAELFFEEAEWTPDCKWVQDFIWGLLQCYMVAENKVLLIKYLPRILAVKELETNLSAALHMAYTEHPDKRIRLCEDLEVFGLRSGNFAYFHLLYTEQNGITTEQDIADYYEKSDRMYDVEVAVLLLNKAKERMMLLGEQKRIGQIEPSVKDYVNWAKKYTEAVCGADAWSRGELPQDVPELAFARVMETVLGESDMAEYGRLLKEALGYCPLFLPVVKTLLEEKEMQTLTAQLKAMAQAQLAAGKPEEAKAILAELATMLPGDEEVKRMLSEL